MKSSSMIAVGTALAGFAMGWILKPSGDSGTSNTADFRPPPRDRPNNSELVAPSRNPGPKKPISLATGPSEVTDPITVRREQAYGQIAGKREKARLARFAEALGLDVDQLETIAGLRSEHKGATNASSTGLLTGAADGKLEFEDALLALLNDDQRVEEDLSIISGELTGQQIAGLRASLEGNSYSLFGKSIRDPRFR